MKPLIFFSLICLILVQFSCKKKPSAGLGGNANLKLIAKHHGLVIDSCTFYIKFNAQDAPSDASYDLTQKAITYSVGDSYSIVSGLKEGQYYIYGRGWDPSISADVSGGVPISISSEGNQDIIVAVTEVH